MCLILAHPSSFEFYMKTPGTPGWIQRHTMFSQRHSIDHFQPRLRALSNYTLNSRAFLAGVNSQRRGLDRYISADNGQPPLAPPPAVLNVIKVKNELTL